MTKKIKKTTTTEKIRPLSPLQVEKQLRALDRLHDSFPVNEFGEADYNRIREGILERLFAK